jgi:hypothetical protein
MAPFEDVLLVVIVQRRTRNILVAEAVKTLAMHLPHQRTPPRLEAPAILDEAGIVAR